MDVGAQYLLQVGNSARQSQCSPADLDGRKAFQRGCTPGPRDLPGARTLGLSARVRSILSCPTSQSVPCTSYASSSPLHHIRPRLSAQARITRSQQSLPLSATPHPVIA